MWNTNFCGSEMIESGSPDRKILESIFIWFSQFNLYDENICSTIFFILTPLPLPITK